MIATVFPGQGSQHPGMGADFMNVSVDDGVVLETLECGEEIRRVCLETDSETLRQTQNAQMALLWVGVSAYLALSEALGSELHVHAMAGHSVGEYAALAASGTLSIRDAIELVRIRGHLMATAGNSRPGAMAAVLGLEKDLLERVCGQSSTPNEIVVIANDNCPGQLVISGDVEAVKRAEIQAKEAGAKRVLMLNVSGAFHSPLMNEPSEKMAAALNPSLFHQPSSGVRVYSNVTAERVDGITEWPELLEAQLRNTVRWTESIQNMIRDGVEIFIECGPGDVLSGLIKRISGDVRTFSVKDRASLDATLGGI